MANKAPSNVSLLLRDVMSDPYIDVNVISLDCWGTIMTLRDSFWEDFAKILRLHFSLNDNISNKEILSTSKKVSIDADRLIADGGQGIDQAYRITKTLEPLGAKYTEGSVLLFTKKIDTLIQNTDYIIILDELLKKELVAVRQRGVRTIILSNTGLISGSQTRQILNQAGLLEVFDYIFMSDETGLVKPTSAAFEHAKTVIDNRYSKDHTFIHIGDDAKADLLGARNAGWVAHSIPYSTNFTALNDRLVSDKAYSKFKFGHTDSVTSIADKILASLTEDAPEVIYSESLAVLHNYRHIPSASTLMSRLVQTKIDEVRVGRALQKSTSLHISRLTDDLNSYSHLSTIERGSYEFEELAISNRDSSAINTPILALDDSYASGSYTKTIRSTLKGHPDLFFAYIKRIYEDKGVDGGTSEDKINHSSISSLDDLEKLHEEGLVQPTRKYYKLLLGSDQEDVSTFLNNLSSDNLNTLVSDLNRSLNDLTGNYLVSAQNIIDIIERKFNI